MVHWALYQEDLNIHSRIISCPDGITPNSGLTGLSILYIYIYIYRERERERERESERQRDTERERETESGVFKKWTQPNK